MTHKFPIYIAIIVLIGLEYFVYLDHHNSSVVNMRVQELVFAWLNFMPFFESFVWLMKQLLVNFKAINYDINHYLERETSNNNNIKTICDMMNYLLSCAKNHRHTILPKVENATERAKLYWVKWSGSTQLRWAKPSRETNETSKPYNTNTHSLTHAIVVLFI